MASPAARIASLQEALEATEPKTLLSRITLRRQLDTTTEKLVGISPGALTVRTNDVAHIELVAPGWALIVTNSGARIWAAINMGVSI